VELVYRLGYTPTTLGVSENMKIPMKKKQVKKDKPESFDDCLLV
jgi:hypothetical protein